MVRAAERSTKDRHSNDAKSSVRAPAKKDGGGGKFTLGKVGDNYGGATVDHDDPNYDPDEKRIDPDDGTAYKYDELAKFYKGKFSAQEIAEYWDYECTAVKRKGRAKATDAAPAGPSLQESATQAKYRVKAKPKEPETQNRRLTQADSKHDGPLAKEVAAVIPYFPYKGLEKFYDVQGLLNHPTLFNAVCAVMAKRLRNQGVTKVAGFHARGYLFSPVAIKLGVPFVMLSKQGQLPNTMSSEPYTKEYAGVSTLCVQIGAIEEGDKVALIDDLVATGGTLCAGIELVKACYADVVECTCMVELKALNGREKCLKAGAKSVWGFIPEDLLTLKAELPEDYVDDGAAH